MHQVLARSLRADLHLLLNTLETSSDLRTSESWLPMCFPKFNPAGFVHAYVSYVVEDVGLVFVSADREAFEDLRGWKAIVLEVRSTYETARGVILTCRNWKGIILWPRLLNLCLNILTPFVSGL